MLLARSQGISEQEEDSDFHLVNEEGIMSGEFIEKCFFILDEDGRDEKCPKEEIMLFFYPEKGMELERKLFLSGSVIAMVKFVEHFTQEPPKTLSLSKAKFSAKQVGDYTLVATGRSDEADSVLQNHIEALYAAYSFYWGPMPLVASRFRTRPRRDFIDCIQRQCQTLIPLLDGFRDKGKLNAFIWLPYSSPPPNTARHFMQASNILSSLQTEPNIHGGCMFFQTPPQMPGQSAQSSVLCTHLDVEITRWILNRVELFRKKKKGTRGDQSLSSQPVFLPVFLSSEQIAKLSMERKPLTQEVIQLLEPRVPLKYHYVLNPVDPKEGEFVTLCLFFKDKITLAIIMDLRNLLDSRDIRVIGMNHGLEGRLGNLERDMVSSLHKSKNHSSSNVLGQYSSGNSDDAPFNYLTTDSLTGMTKGSFIGKHPDSLTEKEDRFLYGSSYVHEAYTNSQISKVMLGDYCGLFYSRHMFSKEVFFQKYFSPTESITLEKLEEHAQTQLGENFKIQLV